MSAEAHGVPAAVADTVFLARDVHESGAKAFGRAPYSVVVAHNNARDFHGYEGIPANVPLYFYVDFDEKAEGGAVPELVERTQSYARQLVATVHEEMRLLAPAVQLAEQDVHVLTATRENKISFHAVFKHDHAFRDMADCKALLVSWSPCICAR